MQKLLLHCCCAPCTSQVLDSLRDIYDITVLFYNPNILPEAEREKRCGELKRMLEIMNKDGRTEIKTADITHAELPLKQNDCNTCIRHRLEFTAGIADILGFDLFTTTLSISPHKNLKLINETGISINPQKYLPADFKKQDGYKKSIELSKKYNLYRQNYCGCSPREMHNS